MSNDTVLGKEPQESEIREAAEQSAQMQQEFLDTSPQSNDIPWDDYMDELEAKEPGIKAEIAAINARSNDTTPDEIMAIPFDELAERRKNKAMNEPNPSSETFKDTDRNGNRDVTAILRIMSITSLESKKGESIE